MPEARDEVVEEVKSVLDSLEKTSIWGLATITAIAQAAIYSDKIIEVPGIKIPREISGVITMVLMCGLNFQLLRLFQLLGHLLESSTSQPAKIAVKTHKWIFNPFAETSGWGSSFSDSFGLSLLLLMWWLGIHSGLHLSGSAASAPPLRQAVSYAFLVLYVILGAMNSRVIWNIMRTVSDKRKLMRLKLSLTAPAMLFGLFGVGAIFLQNYLLGESEKARRALEAMHVEFSDASFLKILRTGDAETTKLFLAAGISPNAEDDNGETALIKSTEKGYSQIVADLIKAGAKVDTKSENYDDTALAAAAGAGNAKIVQILLNAGANLELKCYKERTPLARACFNGQYDVARILIAAGARLDSRDIVNNTPLISAISGFHPSVADNERDRVKLVRLLIDAGANVNDSDGFGTPLGNAAEIGNVEMVTMLLKAGANVNLKSKLKGSPLAEAIGNAGLNFPAERYPPVVQALVAAGADVNETGSNGVTLLMLAASRGQAEVAKALVDAGANTAAADSKGKTVIEYADKDQGILSILQKAGG